MQLTLQTAEAALREILEDLSEDLDTDGTDFDADTRLIDLGLESISLIYLISELQQHFGLGEQLFQKLRREERLLRDMTVGDILGAVVAVGEDNRKGASSHG